MYLERRIIAAVHGDAHFDFSAVIGWKHLGQLFHASPISHYADKMIRGCREGIWCRPQVHSAAD